jgi:hypothetical protein
MWSRRRPRTAQVAWFTARSPSTASTNRLELWMILTAPRRVWRRRCEPPEQAAWTRPGGLSISRPCYMSERAAAALMRTSTGAIALQAIPRLLRVQIARHDQETWLRTTQACRFRCTAVSDRMYGKNFVP